MSNSFDKALKMAPKNIEIKKGKEIDILIDPQNPENIFFKNVI